MDYLQLILLGAVQAVAEFLPISSSGHLLVASALFEQATGAELEGDNIVVTIALHFGTLLAILCVYWRKVLRLVGADRRVIGLMVVGTIPAVVIGLPLKKLCPQVLESTLLAGFMLPITGAIVVWGMKLPPRDGEYVTLPYWKALVIGTAQAVAILPGISRSGMTIMSGLALGMSREAAATFSFLLAIPALAGAQVLALEDLVTKGDSAVPLGPLAVGTVISFVLGIISLELLRRWLSAGRLEPFGCWCIALGAAVVAWQLGAFGGTS